MKTGASLLVLTATLGACASVETLVLQGDPDMAFAPLAPAIRAQLSASNTNSGNVQATEHGGLVFADATGWIDFPFRVETPGRYRCDMAVAGNAAEATVWVEDYIGNPDGRCYDITAPTAVPAGGGAVHKIGSPLNTGERTMRFHYSGGPLTLEALSFTLIREHVLTPKTLMQGTEGEEWVLVWSDEFDQEGHPDSDVWASDIGNWGWGNREPQYYTEGRRKNARCEDGHLIIEAHRQDMGQPWTSARLTTRGKLSFLYGKIEIRGKVPAGDGAWAAGWFLGDAYRDELSWPYCGEIDVLEGVGREIDDDTGKGVNHASCHTRAYYFKQGNHISNTTEVEGMSSDFHTYTVEWMPDQVTIWIDGRKYYVYDKTDGPLEWPFDQPQNLILNLAMGGGMGGAIDPSINRQRFEIDYVRVYGRQ